MSIETREELQSQLSKLDESLRQIDELQRQQRLPTLRDLHGVSEASLVIWRSVKLTIDPDRDRHSLPHFHIRVKNEHAASYRISDRGRLAGEIPDQYEWRLLDWAKDNADLLLRAWNEIGEGKWKERCVELKGK